MSGAELIAAERQRQIEGEGWTAERDAEYEDFELVYAAFAYALHSANDGITAASMWPWDFRWWKPSRPIRDLVKAGALLAAEIDRRIEAGDQP